MMKIDCSRQLCHGQTEIVTPRAPVGAKKELGKDGYMGRIECLIQLMIHNYL